MTDHTVKAFTDELEGLVSAVSRMGGLAEKAVIDSIRAMSGRDIRVAQEVIANDVEIDDAQRDIEKRIMRLLALRHPMAKDLRQTIAALKLAADIERIGDLARSISRRAITIIDHEPIALTRSVERMGKLACNQLKQVLDAYNSHQVGGAISVWFQDEELDDHYASLFRELLTYMMEDPRKIGPATHLLFVAKNIERIGDHCTNMAEVIHFLETGEDISGVRPKGETDSYNSKA
ncbi:phosphate signaling complex protein PhoU [Pseudaquidulcibacter saccharophilus]|jgi:phosphate transport system protein|uniref:phosphate signaling complex protein PhoU n=1 Tax=Pseudaquidulcibacter saccharophilus TaxID=2831900 RepID=UPI001EFF4750|nr:phosphate signaling complex protein PhoU [Pseudaquidulcibacter saccharophilus]